MILELSSGILVNDIMPDVQSESSKIVEKAYPIATEADNQFKDVIREGSVHVVKTIIPDNLHVANCYFGDASLTNIEGIFDYVFYMAGLYGIDVYMLTGQIKQLNKIQPTTTDILQTAEAHHKTKLITLEI